MGPMNRIIIQSRPLPPLLWALRVPPGSRPLPGKRRAYRPVSSALPFVPVSVESFGRLGAQP
jgi:hypothetical protein